LDDDVLVGFEAEADLPDVLDPVVEVDLVAVEDLAAGLLAVDFDAVFLAGVFLAGAFFAGAFLAGAVRASTLPAPLWTSSETASPAASTRSAALLAALPVASAAWRAPLETRPAAFTPMERVWRATVPRVSSPTSTRSSTTSAARETCSFTRARPASSCGFSSRSRVTTSSPRAASPP